MTIGASLFLIAAGAILRYAVTDSVSGIDLTTVGLILLIVGVVGLVLGLFMTFAATRRGTVVTQDRYVDPPPRY
jgi:beta-lactamase regulating signal transducer with metallopeptidase domain